MLEATPTLQRELFYGKLGAIEVKRTAEHTYIGVRPIDDVIISQPPIDCWKLYAAFMKKNKPHFQAIANQNCRDFLGCWCCPGGGLCVTFFVKPTSPPCLMVANPVFAEKIVVREF